MDEIVKKILAGEASPDEQLKFLQKVGRDLSSLTEVFALIKKQNKASHE